MTNLIKTLITGVAITIGAAASAQATDDTFTAVITQDETVSVEDNYASLREQAKTICKQEAQRAGFRRTESSTWLRRKCEKDILAKVIKVSNDPELTFVHNETWGVKLKTKSYAQK